jgi:superfamily II DNA/RNA helicase
LFKLEPGVPVILQTSDISIKAFEEMGLADRYVSFLKHQGITKPTEVQARAIPVALTGADVIAIAQTGSGKTLAFVLPIFAAFEKKPEARGIVFVPSREMAQQIFKVFHDLSPFSGIEPCLIIGGIPNDKQVSLLRKCPRLIIATPGRMNDHLLNNKLLLKGVEVVVLDEADRMLDMGFAPQLESIRRTLRGDRQTLMFSASFSPSVEKMAEGFFLQEPFMIRAKAAEKPVSQLRQKILFLNKKDKNDQLITELKNTKKSVIIFTADQGRCEYIGKHLQDNGFSSDIVHGGLTQGHRNRVVREFREGTIRMLVATDLLARGIDVPEVTTVINVDFPFQPEDYLHRIGRTARAGRSGKAVTFVTPLDGEGFKKIESYIEDAEQVTLAENFAFIKR